MKNFFRRFAFDVSQTTIFSQEGKVRFFCTPIKRGFCGHRVTFPAALSGRKRSSSAAIEYARLWPNWWIRLISVLKRKQRRLSIVMNLDYFVTRRFCLVRTSLRPVPKIYYFHPSFKHQKRERIVIFIRHKCCASYWNSKVL